VPSHTVTTVDGRSLAVTWATVGSVGATQGLWGSYANGLHVAVRLEPMSDEDIGLVHLLLDRIVDSDGGQVLFLEEGAVVLAHPWAPPPEPGPPTGVVHR